MIRDNFVLASRQHERIHRQADFGGLEHNRRSCASELLGSGAASAPGLTLDLRGSISTCQQN